MKMQEGNQFIRSIELQREKVGSFSKYPFCLPAIQNLSSLKLHPRVTFIIGENGAGKSTIYNGPIDLTQKLQLKLY